MDAISHEYTKQRRDFGIHPKFEDQAAKILSSCDGTLDTEEGNTHYSSITHL
jgi:hypothetical protein